MGNIDEKYLASLLGRIDSIKSELLALEEEVRAAFTPVPEPAPTVPELVEGPVEEPAEGPVEGVVSTSSTTVPAVPEPVPAVPEPTQTVHEPTPAVPERVEEPEEAAIEDDIPIDISISDIEMPVPPVVEPVDDMPDPASDGDATEEGIPMDIDVPEPTPAVPEPVEGSAEGGVSTSSTTGPAPKKSILDSAKADTAVMDIMAEKQAWRTDRPGMPVKNIISAISLNDRVLLINVLFGEDPMLFQETIAKFNAMGSLSEALSYIAENHSDWDMNSEPVYRLMMAVRRKLS